MTAYFLDSSILVKRYVTEVGSTWVRGLTAPTTGNILIVTRITWVEVLSALARLQRELTLSSTDVNLAVRAFQHDWAVQYQVVEVNHTLVENAGKLLFKHPLRAYDSIQLAAALELLPSFSTSTAVTYTFMAADVRLLTAANAEGLTVDNPHNYP